MESNTNGETHMSNTKKTKVRNKLKAIFSLGVKRKPQKDAVDMISKSKDVDQDTISSTVETKQKGPHKLLAAWGSEKGSSCSEEDAEIKDEEHDEEKVEVTENRKSKFAQIWKNISHRTTTEKLKQTTAITSHVPIESEITTLDRLDITSFEGMDVDSFPSDLDEMVNCNKSDNSANVAKLQEVEDSIATDLTSRDISSDTDNNSMRSIRHLNSGLSSSQSVSRLSSFEDGSSGRQGEVNHMGFHNATVNQVNMFAAKSCPALHKPRTIGQRFRSVFTLIKATKRLGYSGSEARGVTEGLDRITTKAEDISSMGSPNEVANRKKRGLFGRSSVVETPTPEDPLNYDSTLDLRLDDGEKSDESSDTSCDYLNGCDIVNKSVTTKNVNAEVISEGKKAPMYISDSISNVTDISTMAYGSCRNDTNSAYKCTEVVDSVSDSDTVSSEDKQEQEEKVVPKSPVAVIVGNSKSRRGSLTNSVRNLALKSSKLKKVILISKVANMFSRKKSIGSTILQESHPGDIVGKDDVKNPTSKVNVSSLLPRSDPIDNTHNSLVCNNNIPNVNVLEEVANLSYSEKVEQKGDIDEDINENNTNECLNCKR